MRDYIEGLKAAPDKVGYILDNKTQSIKIMVAVIAVMTVAMLLLYRGGDEVDIVESAKTADSEESRAFAQESGSYGGDTASDGGDTASYGADAQTYGQEGGAETAGLSGPSQTAAGDIYVDVGGAVKSPMLVKLPVGSRVEDAIQKAGGLADDADLTTINRAEMLVDGQKIYIPKAGEVGVDGISGLTSSQGAGSSTAASPGSGASSSGSPGGIDASGKVNINTADSTQLQTITGIGPATAQKILDYRTQNGRFNTIDDLKNVSGIGDKTFEKMKDQVVV